MRVTAASYFRMAALKSTAEQARGFPSPARPTSRGFWPCHANQRVGRRRLKATGQLMPDGAGTPAYRPKYKTSQAPAVSSRRDGAEGPDIATAGYEGGDMADVFTVLAKDHQEVKHVLAELEKGPAMATGTSGDQLALRKKMTQELIIEESKHEALEEMYFWPAVREHLAAGHTLADEATGQEQE